jgi:hypothetical protein
MNQNNKKSNSDYKHFAALGFLAGTSAMLYNLKTSEAESNEDDKGEPKTFFQKNVLDYK